MRSDLLHTSDRPPIFIGAGVNKTEDQITHCAQAPMLRAQIMGSYSEPEWSGSDPTGKKIVFWWDEQNLAAYNAFGLKNCGRKAASEFLPRAINVVKGAGQLAIVGITPLKHEDPVKTIPGMVEWALEMGADGVEINGSCPNEQHHNLLCENVDLITEAISSTRDRVGDESYLMLKVSALNETAIKQYRTKGLLRVDAVDTINNCRYVSPLNPASGLPVIEVNDGFAGQSGPVIRDLARNNLRLWQKTYELTKGQSPLSKFDMWSIGGVADGEEVHCRYNHMGAVMVGGAQAFYRAQDPNRVTSRWASEYTARMSVLNE